MDLSNLLADKAREVKPLEVFTHSQWDNNYPLFARKHWNQKQNLRAYHDSQELYALLVEQVGAEVADRVYQGGTFADLFPPSREGKRKTLELTELMTAHYRNSVETALDMPIGFLDSYPDAFVLALRAEVEKLLAAAEPKPEPGSKSAKKSRRSTKQSPQAAA